MDTVLNFKADIGVEDVMRQNENETAKKVSHVAYDAKNYLNARLEDNETSKTLTIRLLPFSPEGGSPFFKVWMHTVRVNKELSKNGWKSFVCLNKNNNGHDCPYCQLAEQSKELKNATSDEIKKKQFSDLEFANRAKEMWIVRCIERGKEDEGVKFWMFSHSKKEDGVYDKIMNIFKRRAEQAKAKGKECNIFSLSDGKDLEITLTRNTANKTAIAIVDSDERTPISEDVNLANNWITDTKKWSDVFTEKPYDYMAITLTGGVPFFDKEKKKYVPKLSKDEYMAQQNQKQESESKNTINAQQEFTKTSDEKDDLPF